MENNKKTLYFEGAGMSETKRNDLNNCRIRTAFINLDGKEIYLELESGNIYNKKEKEIDKKYFLVVDHLFYIIDGIGNENENGIRHNHLDLRENYLYNNDDITAWINKNLNCKFDDVEILPNLAGYRVHGDNRSYNLVENFIYNKELTAKREEVKEYFNKLEKSEGKKYPNFSIWVDEKDLNILHLLRYFNGCNKHWEINTDLNNCIDEIKETKLGQYGC